MNPTAALPVLAILSIVLAILALALTWAVLRLRRVARELMDLPKPYALRVLDDRAIDEVGAGVVRAIINKPTPRRSA